MGALGVLRAHAFPRIRDCMKISFQQLFFSLSVSFSVSDYILRILHT